MYNHPRSSLLGEGGRIWDGVYSLQRVSPGLTTAIHTSTPIPHANTLFISFPFSPVLILHSLATLPGNHILNKVHLGKCGRQMAKEFGKMFNITHY